MRQAQFLGGEPFLARETLEIWDLMLADGLTTPCAVTTNGTIYNARVERILDALPVTATGKIDKKALRNRFADHLMSDEDGGQKLREDVRQ